MKKIDLLDLKGQYQKIKSEIDSAIQEVLENTNFIMGHQVKDLEQKICDYTGAGYSIACASGSDALLLSLMALDIKKGDEVITTPYTFFATAGAIHRVGAKPVFVDIDSSDCNIDVEKIEEKITDRTKAIIPVHLYGKCADMQRIMQLGQRHGLYIIEDACKAIGAEYRFVTGQSAQAGTMGHTGCFSFFPSKNLGAFGDAGMITTNDKNIAEKLRVLRVHGSKPKYFHKVVGINSRLDTIQAAILLVKLRYLSEWTENRIRVAENYRELFEESSLNNHIEYYDFSDYKNQHIYHQYVIQAKNRDELKQYLSQKNIGTAVYYPLPLHIQECFSYLGYSRDDMPVALGKSDTALALPIDPGITEEEQQYIVKTISSFYRAL
ncbi:MAG: DegT/DnrJ/EryC1/StrS family aminotransferase [Candidatus Muiribacteriaceae bacterium]